MLANVIKFRWKDSDGTEHYEILELNDTYDVMEISAYIKGEG